MWYDLVNMENVPKHAHEVWQGMGVAGRVDKGKGREEVQFHLDNLLTYMCICRNRFEGTIDKASNKTLHV